MLRRSSAVKTDVLGEDVANELVDWFNAAEFRTELQHVRTELQRVRTELLRWMFGFWVTTLLSIGGLLVAILNFAP